MVANLAAIGYASAAKWAAVGLAVAISALNAGAYAKRASGTSSAWYAKLGVLAIVVMGLGCVLYAACSSEWRDMAREAGVYDQRKKFQFYASATLLVSLVAAALVAAYFSGSTDAAVCIAALLGYAILVVEMLHVVSFHPVDSFFATKLAPGLSLRAALQAILFLQFNLALLAGHRTLTRTQRQPVKA